VTVTSTRESSRELTLTNPDNTAIDFSRYDTAGTNYRLERLVSSAASPAKLAWATESSMALIPEEYVDPQVTAGDSPGEAAADAADAAPFTR
jgi:hypothetical protein